MPDHPEPPDRPPRAPREAVQRWRLVLARGALEGDLGQREQLARWEAALSSSGLPLAGLDGSPPRPRFMPAAPLGASIAGEAELVDVWLTERVPAWRVRDALAASVPAGFRLTEAYDVWLGAPALPGQVVASVYRVTLDGAARPDAVRGAAEALLDAPTIPRQRAKGTGTVSYDLRPFIDGLEVTGRPGPGGTAETLVRMTLRHDPEKGIGRPDEVVAALGDALGGALAAREIVRERLVLAPPPAASSAAVAGSRRRQPGSAATRRPRK